MVEEQVTTRGAAADAGASELPLELRRERIARRVREEGFSRVTDLAAWFGVSEVTVRSDLAGLEQEARVRRVRGGAVPIAGPLAEQSLERTQDARAKEKHAIGRTAAALIAPGETVLLDVGSTALATAQALTARRDLADVTVFTNGLSIALELERAIPRLTVVVTGGTLRPLQHSLVDPLADRVLEGVRADTVVLGCNGISVAQGVTNINLPEAEVKRRMIVASSRRVVLADAAKVGAVSLATLADAEVVDVLVTGPDADPGELDQLRELGVHVEVAH